MLNRLLAQIAAWENEFDIQDIRPALLEESFKCLDELRAFRHFSDMHTTWIWIR